MPKRKKLFLALALLAIAVATGVFLRTRHRSPENLVATTGVMEATEVELSSKTAGKIEWLCCKEGDAINAGDTAIRLDSAEIKARVEEKGAALTGAESGITEAKVALENAFAQNESALFDSEATKAEVERALALLNEAKENVERARGLFKDGYMAKKDMDAAEAANASASAVLSTARARSRSSQATLKNSEVNIKAARARINSAESRKAEAEAELKALLAGLDDTVITSPINGVIVYKAFEAGEFAAPGAPIYTIDDLSNLWARVDIEESGIQRVTLGAAAKVALPGGASYDGKVVEIGEVGSFATQRDVTRGRPDIKTFRVKVSVAGHVGALKPGMTVDVSISTEQANVRDRD